MTNPLLASWDAPFGLPPFAAIDSAHFRPAFDEALSRHRAEIDAIAKNPAPPTFDTVIGALQASGEDLDRVSSMFSLMTANMNRSAYQALDREWSPKFAALDDEINLDPKLFARVDALYQARASAKLSPTQLRLLERTWEDFVRSGAKLSAADKPKLAAMNQELATLFTEFNQNVQNKPGASIPK